MFSKIANYTKKLYNSSIEGIGVLGKWLVEPGDKGARRSSRTGRSVMVKGEVAPQKLTETLKNKHNGINELKLKKEKFKLDSVVRRFLPTSQCIVCG